MSELYDEEYLKASEKFKAGSGETAQAYSQWHAKASGAGVLDKKTKELIALGASCAIQCVYCIDSHSQKAKAYGATAQEIAEVIQVASIVKSGSTMSYGINALKHFKE
jgi:AhpD family alkylhydroperoxidase